MLPPEPSFSVLHEPVSVYGIERGWGYGLMLPGIVVLCAGLLRLSASFLAGLLLMALGAAMVPGLILIGRMVCGHDPQRMSGYLVAAFSPRRFVPHPGLYGEDERK